MAFDIERAIVNRLREAMKGIRLAMEEAKDSVDQYNALGSAAFDAYKADPSFGTEQNGITGPVFVDGVTALNNFITTWGSGNHTNVNKAAKP